MRVHVPGHARRKPDGVQGLMNDLRLILLGLGVLLIAAIWLWSLHARRRRGPSRAARRPAKPHSSVRRRGASKGEAIRKTSGPSQAKRGETPGLDLALDPEDEEPDLPPLGLDFPETDGDAGDGAHVAGRGPVHASDGEDEGAHRSVRERGSVSTAPTRPRGPRRGRHASSTGGASLAAAEAGEGLEGLRATRDEPEQLAMESFDLGGDDPAPGAESEDANAGSEDDESKTETLVVILTVLAPKGGRLEGAALHAALQAQGLRYGEDRIFHRYSDTAPAGTGSLFSAVNIVEPGVFDLETMDSMHTPGVGLFMRLPGPKDPGNAFADMVETARALANALEAQLCDETRSKLTTQALNHLRERIADFGRRRLLRV